MPSAASRDRAHAPSPVALLPAPTRAQCSFDRVWSAPLSLDEAATRVRATNIVRPALAVELLAHDGDELAGFAGVRLREAADARTALSLIEATREALGPSAEVPDAGASPDRAAHDGAARWVAWVASLDALLGARTFASPADRLEVGRFNAWSDPWRLPDDHADDLMAHAPASLLAPAPTPPMLELVHEGPPEHWTGIGVARREHDGWVLDAGRLHRVLRVVGRARGSEHP